jgi:hypothetical protein
MDSLDVGNSSVDFTQLLCASMCSSTWLTNKEHGRTPAVRSSTAGFAGIGISFQEGAAID